MAGVLETVLGALGTRCPQKITVPRVGQTDESPEVRIPSSQEIVGSFPFSI